MMNRLSCFFWLYFLTFPVFAQNLKVVNLTCEYTTNPLGVETPTPGLSWNLQSNSENVVQVAYQILVADNITDLDHNKGTTWDSQKVNSNQSIQVRYKGRPLLAAKTYFWKVKIWDNQKNTAWSPINTWQMGLLSAADWFGAKWIAYEKLADSNINVLPTDGKKDKFNSNNILPLLRKGFTVSKPIKKATVFIAGLGHFEMSLNGLKVGDHFLDAGWTKYDKEALYVSFDLTKQMQQGENVLGVMLGNGFYYIPPVKERYRKLKAAFGYPKMICRLLIQYADGTTANIVSNETWRTSPSPITFSSIYGGEDYNANLEQKNWDRTGFDVRQWKNALIVNGPKLNSQKQEPLKVFDNFKAQTIREVNGEWVYDLGQNASGVIELKVSGKKGDTVRITPAELLKADGTVNQRPSGSPFYFTYILKGEGVEIWRPRFTYYGFRYLQVKGARPVGKGSDLDKPVMLELVGLHIRNSAKKMGSFESSSELFNKTYNLIDWAIKSNMVSVFTDCPHREKLGWLEQVHLMGSSVRYNYDAATLFRKSVRDMANSQTPDGLIPETAPEYVKFEWGGDMFRDSPEWGSSSILVPWYLYQWYGDERALAESYPMMKRYLDYLATKANGYILSQGLGDWYDLGPKPPGVSQLTPMGITATAIYYYDLTIMHAVAEKLGKQADAKKYLGLADEVRKAFNHKFFNEATKQYGTGSQTANAMAVYMGLVAPEHTAVVIANIIKDIREKNNSLTAGDIGYRYLLRVLEDAGRSDVIFDMNSRSDVPGYGMQIAKGATALTESWQALPTNSNNHFMLGHLMEWFYSGLGGIKMDDGGIAFNKIKIHPEFVGNLSAAKANYQSPYGLIAASWKKSDDTISMEVIIPANTTAKIFIPVKDVQQLKEANGLPFKIVGSENGRSIIAIGSGTYKFEAR